MSQIITPTIGRRVWYYPSDYDCGLRQDLDVQPPTVIVSDGVQPCDAGVCYVHNDRLVNLTVADSNGKMHARTSVRLLQPGEDVPEPGSVAYATWMPYQIEAALRHAEPAVAAAGG